VEDRWLTVDEVATYTQYSRRTIERALAAGDLRSARPVQDHRIRQSWVDAWMESAA
jgi:excisionase family DNA binding protein